MLAQHIPSAKVDSGGYLKDVNISGSDLRSPFGKLTATKSLDFLPMRFLLGFSFSLSDLPFWSPRARNFVEYR